MSETAIKHERNTKEKQCIRDKHKGVDLDELDVISAVPQEDFSGIPSSVTRPSWY